VLHWVLLFRITLYFIHGDVNIACRQLSRAQVMRFPGPFIRLQLLLYVIERSASSTGHDIGDSISHGAVVQMIVSLKYQPDTVLLEQGVQPFPQSLVLVPVTAY